MDSALLESMKSVLSSMGRTSSGKSIPGVFVDAHDSSEGEDIAQASGTASAPKVRRVYYLDWFRIVAIYLVVMYHCVQSLGWIHLWDLQVCGVVEQPLQRNITVSVQECVQPYKASINVYKCFSLMVGMPVFFHISGRAQALARPKGVIETTSKRIVRLGIPFVVCYFALIPFWQYVEYVSSDWPEYVEYRNNGMPLQFPQWLYWFFSGHFVFNAAWLWFLPTLLVIGIFNAPLFLYAEHRERKYLYLSVLVLMLMVAILLAFRFSLALCFFVVLGPAMASLLARIVHFRPLWDHSWSARRIVANAVLTSTFIGSHVGVVLNFRYDELSGPIKALPASLLFYGFYTHGYFAQRWECDIDMEGDLPPQENGPAESRPLPTTDSASSDSGDSGEDATDFESGIGHHRNVSRRRLRMTERQVLITARIARVALGFLTILAMAVGAPNGEWEEELFPLYSASYKPGAREGVNGLQVESRFFCVAHIISTWAYVYMTVKYFAAYADYEMHPKMYQHASKSTMVTYIFHFVFAKAFTFWGVKAAGMTDGWFLLLDPIIVFIVAVSGSFGVYMLFVRVPALGALFGL